MYLYAIFFFLSNVIIRTDSSTPSSDDEQAHKQGSGESEINLWRAFASFFAPLWVYGYSRHGHVKKEGFFFLLAYGELNVVLATAWEELRRRFSIRLSSCKVGEAGNG